MASDHSTRVAPERKSKPAGWAKIPHEVTVDDRLKGCDFRVLARLVYHARDSGVCWPSVMTLARDLGLARRTVQIALKRLEGLGYVAVELAPQRATGRQFRLSLGGAAASPEGETVSAPALPPAPPPAIPCAPPASGIAPLPRCLAAPELESPVRDGEPRTNPPLAGQGTISRLPGTERPATPWPPRIPEPSSPLGKILLRFAEQDCRPEWMAKVLAEDFADGKSYNFYLKVARERPWIIPEAYEAARGPGVEVPAAMFAAVVNRIFGFRNDSSQFGFSSRPRQRQKIHSSPCRAIR